MILPSRPSPHAHNLGIKVVAEGVASQAIWQRLAALGGDVEQGYLIGMPMPAAQFEQWMQGRRPCRVDSANIRASG